jgi:hypothetical protein
MLLLFSLCLYTLNQRNKYEAIADLLTPQNVIAPFSTFFLDVTVDNCEDQPSHMYIYFWHTRG